MTPKINAIQRLIDLRKALNACSDGAKALPEYANTLQNTIAFTACVEACDDAEFTPQHVAVFNAAIDDAYRLIGTLELSAAAYQLLHTVTAIAENQQTIH